MIGYVDMAEAETFTGLQVVSNDAKVVRDFGLGKVQSKFHSHNPVDRRHVYYKNNFVKLTMSILYA